MSEEQKQEAVPPMTFAVKICDCQEVEKDIVCSIENEVGETILTVEHEKCGAYVRFVCVLESKYREGARPQ
jgi:hypothetical protein